jgi:hypothetical protein
VIGELLSKRGDGEATLSIVTIVEMAQAGMRVSVS